MRPLGGNRHEDGAFRIETGAVTRKENYGLSFPRGNTMRRQPSETHRAPSPDIRPAACLILDLLFSRAVRNDFLLFIHSVYDILV